MTKSKVYVAVRAILFLLPLVLLAQTDRGIITGVVTDSTGAIVPSAKITITNTATNVQNTGQTTATGNYTVPSLPPGTYTLRAEAPGFKTYERTNVVVIAGGTINVDAVLEVGQVTESISVTSSLTQVQTETAKVTTQVSTKMIDELPLVVGGAMRGAFDLAALTPQANIPDRPGDQRDRGFSVGGGQAGAYGATLDGISVLTSRFNSIQWANVNTPSVDGITEFSVETNGFKAEFGRGREASSPSPRSRARMNSTALPTSSSETIRSTPAASSKRKRAFTSRTISASASAVRFTSRSSTTERTRRSSLSPPNGFATASAPPASASASQPRRCIKAISVIGWMGAGTGCRSTIPLPRDPIPAEPGMSAIPSPTT